MSTVVDTRSPSETAFAELYERNVDRVFGFCHRRLRSRQEAEDAVQETFVAAMRAIQRGSVPVCESAWLYKIAENVCFAAYRAGARRPATDLADSDRIARLPAGESSADSLFGLEEALDALPDSQRSAFVLRELRGLSYKEIALQLGVSVASVETLIYRARRSLARGLEAGAGLRGRVTAGLNLGSIAATAKSWLAGATAVKIASAATVAALASTAVGDAPQQVRERRTPQAVQPASIRDSVVPVARRGADARPMTKQALRRAPMTPRPRPQRRQAQPVGGARTTPPTSSVPAETLVVRPTTPTTPASPTSPPAVDPLPQAPLPPAVDPVKVEAPQAPVSVEIPVPAAPPLPELPTPGELLPEVPPLLDLPPLPEIPSLP